MCVYVAVSTVRVGKFTETLRLYCALKWLSVYMTFCLYSKSSVSLSTSIHQLFLQLLFSPRFLQPKVRPISQLSNQSYIRIVLQPNKYPSKYITIQIVTNLLRSTYASARLCRVRLRHVFYMLFVRFDTSHALYVLLHPACTVQVLLVLSETFSHFFHFYCQFFITVGFWRCDARSRFSTVLTSAPLVKVFTISVLFVWEESNQLLWPVRKLNFYAIKSKIYYMFIHKYIYCMDCMYGCIYCIYVLYVYGTTFVWSPTSNLNYNSRLICHTTLSPCA